MSDIQSGEPPTLTPISRSHEVGSGPGFGAPPAPSPGVLHPGSTADIYGDTYLEVPKEGSYLFQR